MMKPFPASAAKATRNPKLHTGSVREGYHTESDGCGSDLAIVVLSEASPVSQEEPGSLPPTLAGFQSV